MTSLDIKFALLWYFRFKRQWICTTEFLMWDVVVFTNDYLIETEVKVSKSDLWNGEAKKEKHNDYKAQKYPMPNKFYICVPETLLNDAKEWVEATNKNYGIITYHSHFDIRIYKKAKLLKNGCDAELQYKCMKRVCTENIMAMQHKLAEKEPTNDKGMEK